MTSSRAIRPRVVHVTTAHWADDVRIFERECRSLANSGRYDVFLAAAGNIPSDTQVVMLPLQPAPASRVGRFVRGPRQAFRFSRATPADLWHFHDPELLPVALKLARSGAPVIWDAHEDYLAQFEADGAKSWVPRPVRGVVRQGMKAILAAVDRDATAVITATPTIAARYANPRTVVVGNEARLEDFASCTPDFASKRVLFTGGVNSGHLFEDVVAAVDTLPSVKLVVAGREPDHLAWSAARARLGQRIEYLGWLDRRGLCEAIGQSSLGLATYADTVAYSLAAPTKLFEFCAAGLPVIATPNASILGFARQGCGVFVAEGFNASAIAREIEAALADPTTWHSASAEGRQWAIREGAWERSEARLLALYESILFENSN